MVVLSDTSAISALLQVGRVEILQELYGDVIIPVAVERELRRSHSCIPDFIKVLSVAECPALQMRCAMLDKGEAHAITLAEQLHADLLIIDERKGRLEAPAPQSTAIPDGIFPFVLQFRGRRGIRSGGHVHLDNLIEFSGKVS